MCIDSASLDEEGMKKNRSWLKRRRRLVYFTNLVQELNMEDTQSFKEMLRMSFLDQHTPHQVHRGNKVITALEMP